MKMVMYDELYHIKLGDKMTEFLYLIIIMFTFGIFCKYFLTFMTEYVIFFLRHVLNMVMKIFKI